jgi:glycine hydroxymethyltransferase
MRATGLNGAETQRLLERVRITVNKNAVPFDTLPHALAGGIRVGAAAVTTRGFGEDEMRATARLIVRAVTGREDEQKLRDVERDVLSLVNRFPLYEFL